MTDQSIIRASDSGPETVVAATSKDFVGNINLSVSRDPYCDFVRRTFRQVAWLGHTTGLVYRYDEEEQARANEPGGYAPMYIEVTE